MASIKGFQLKNVKQPLGREGYGCIATMYLHGKKIGTYEDYGDGACEDVRYVSKDAEADMMRVIIDYAKEYDNKFIINLYNERPQQFKEECENFKKYHPYIPDEDITIQTMASNSIVYIVEGVLGLMEDEKQFKKYQKKGYRAISIDRKDGVIYGYPASWSDVKIQASAKGHELYMSLDDFNK
jgi:hypothetical protein